METRKHKIYSINFFSEKEDLFVAFLARNSFFELKDKKFHIINQ